MTTCYAVKRQSPTSEPDVDQGIIHGRKVTWNPDDGKFYVERADGRAAVFTRFSNVVQYARKANK